MAINGGPYFEFNPSISFIVNVDQTRDYNSRQELDQIWKKLSKGGTILMPLQEYPFSKRYGWIQDKFGLTWQLNLINPNAEEIQFVIPSLMFVQDVCGKAEEASEFYLSVFNDSKRGMIDRYPPGMDPDKEGTIMYSDFQLEKQSFAVMDSAQSHNFKFNEAISFLVKCENQDEIDYYWKNLTFDPKAEQCGWLKDKYGISWQIWPVILEKMMANGKKNQIDRIIKSFLKMKKFNIEELNQAFNRK